jgi:hypothetical protein
MVQPILRFWKNGDQSPLFVLECGNSLPLFILGCGNSSPFLVFSVAPPTARRKTWLAARYLSRKSGDESPHSKNGRRRKG